MSYAVALSSETVIDMGHRIELDQDGVDTLYDALLIAAKHTAPGQADHLPDYPDLPDFIHDLINLMKPFTTP